MAHKPPYDTPGPKKDLSEVDKERIKQAVLESASKNTAYSPDKLAKATCDAICLIDSYKR